MTRHFSSHYVLPKQNRSGRISSGSGGGGSSASREKELLLLRK